MLPQKKTKRLCFSATAELLNSLDSNATTKLTINNRRMNRVDFEKHILIGMKKDKLDEYRREYNHILLDKATGADTFMRKNILRFLL